MCKAKKIALAVAGLAVFVACVADREIAKAVLLLICLSFVVFVVFLTIHTHRTGQDFND